MANEQKDVLRLHGTETGLQGLMRLEMDGYATDTYKLIHKFPDGTVKKWTPDEAWTISAEDVSYTNSIYTTLTDVDKALDYLLRIPLDIYTFTADTTLFAKGLTINEIDYEWGVTGTTFTQSLSTSDGGLSVAIDWQTEAYTYTGMGLTGSLTATLAVSDSVDTVEETVTTQAALNVYWGTSSNGYTAITEADIEAAGFSQLKADTASSRALSQKTIGGEGDYVIYAYPAAWGDVSLTVNGFGSSWNYDTVSVNNGHISEDYRCYVSPYTIVGNITLSATAA